MGLLLRKSNDYIHSTRGVRCRPWERLCLKDEDPVNHLSGSKVNHERFSGTYYGTISFQTLSKLLCCGPISVRTRFARSGHELVHTTR